MDESKHNTVVNVTSILVGFVAYMYNYIGELLLLIPLSMIIDYTLGIIANLYQGKKFDKEVGLWGFIRKTLYLVVIIGGFIIDYLIYTLSQHLGIQFDYRGIFVIATTVYLIGTEWLSILKHLNTLEIPTPKFLKKAFTKVLDESKKLPTKK